MSKNKLLLLGSSLGTLLLFIVAAVQENIFKEWRRIQAQSHSESGAIDPHLRQIVVPVLHKSDRCVSCHLGMSPGEAVLHGPRVTATHPPVYHDPAEWGCTVCHAGQGHATEKADAHGSVLFWPEPMIPLQYADAGCGSCHRHLKVPSLARTQHGARLFEQFDCLACHRMDRRGGTLRPGGMEGPDLTMVGATGYRADWYRHHRLLAAAGADPLWKANFRDIAEVDRRDVDVYLSTCVGAPRLVEAKALFHAAGCRGCHKVHGIGGDDGPDLSAAGQKDPGQIDFSHVAGEHTLAGWFAEHFRNPAGVVRGSTMPALGLSEWEINRLTLYLFSLRNHNYPEAFWPKDRLLVERFGHREFSADGESLYRTFCSSCHGASGQGMRYAGMPAFPAITSADFLAIAPDSFIVATIRHGRPGRRMPEWGEKAGGLRRAEIDSIAAFVRHLGGVQAIPDVRPPRWARGDIALGERLYKVQCSGCHGSRGQGGEGVSLNNPVLLAGAGDTYLFRTIADGRRGTEMKAFADASTATAAMSPAEIESIISFIRTWEKKP